MKNILPFDKDKRVLKRKKEAASENLLKLLDFIEEHSDSIKDFLFVAAYDKEDGEYQRSLCTFSDMEAHWMLSIAASDIAMSHTVFNGEDDYSF